MLEINKQCLVCLRCKCEYGYFGKKRKGKTGNA